MKKPNSFNKALQKTKDVITNYDFVIGIKRMSIGVLTFLLCFIFLIIFDCVPSAFAISSGLIEQQDDFHTIDGCWYSLTPSTIIGSTTTEIKNKYGNNYTKYCYSIIDDNDGIHGADRDSYQYIVNEDSQVYVFEYYTWLDANTTDTQKIAVYSETDLLQKDVNGKKMYYLKNGDNSYVFETVDDYLYYRAYRFLPDWKEDGNAYYSQSDKLGFDDNSYYGYQLINDDNYKAYKNINVSTYYTFDIEENDVIFYNNVSIDDDGNIVYNATGSTDTSERKIINRNDINQATYVIESMGDAFVYTDVNGKTSTEAGFNPNMYYKGNFMYIYDTFETDSPKGKQTVSAFKIYKMLDDVKEVDLPAFDLNSGYSLLTFKADTKALIAEAVRYYNLYEISYELVQNTSSSDFINKTDNDINSHSSVPNIEVEKDNDGNPTAYKMIYNYVIELKNAYDYKITYTRQNFIIDNCTYTKTKNDTYILNRYQTEVLNPNLNGIKSISEFNDANSSTLNKFVDSNTEFYELIGDKTVDWCQDEYNYSVETEAGLDYGSTSVESQWYEKINNNANTGYIKSNISPKSNTVIKYTKNSDGTITYSTSSISNCYSYNGYYYQNKSPEYYYGRKTPISVIRKDFYNKTSLPNNISELNSVNIKANATSGSGTYGFTYTTNPSTMVPNLNTYYISGITAKYSFEQNECNEVNANISKTPLYEFCSMRTSGNNLIMKISPTTLWSDDSLQSYNAYNYYSLGFPALDYTNDSSDGGDSYYYDMNSCTIKNGNIAQLDITFTNGLTTTKYYNNYNQEQEIKLDYPIKKIKMTLAVEQTEGESGAYTNDNYIYYQCVYNVFFNASPITYNYSYYEYTVGTPEYQYYPAKSDSGVTCTKSEGTQYCWYWTEAGYYKYSGAQYQLKSEDISYKIGDQLNSSGMRLNRNTTYFDAGNSSSIKLNLTGTKTGALNNEQINTLETQIRNNKPSNVAITSLSINKSTGVVTMDVIYNENYYFKNSNIAQSSGNITKTYIITPIHQQISGTNYYYNIYKISYDVSETDYSKNVNSTTEQNKIPNLSRGAEYSMISGGTAVASGNNYVKVYTTTTKYNQNHLVGYVDTQETVDYYSNSPSSALSGDYYIGYTNDGTEVTLKRVGTHLSSTTGDDASYWKAGIGYANTDVNEAIKFSKTFIVNDTSNKCNDSSNEAYYKTQLEAYLGKSVSSDDILANKTTNPTCINLYSGSYITYSTSVIPVKKIYNYGTTSANFGSSNVKSQSYYSDVTYDENGKIISGTWNGSRALPTSYNLINNATFFNSIDGYKRVETQNGITTITLNAPITLNISQYVKDEATKTYYLSYYLNGVKVSKTFKGNSKELFNFPTQTIGSNSNYTLSRIMFSTTPNDYTDYVAISEKDYNEKNIAHKYQVTNEWYETNITATAIITNLSDVISSDGVWNPNVNYSFTLNGETFNYTDDQKLYLTGSEYYFDDVTRMRWKSENTKFAYVLNRKILVTKDEDYGFDFINTTVNANLNGVTYYGTNSGLEPTVNNTSKAVIKIASTPYGSGSYVSLSSIIGQLSLYNLAGYSLDNIYLIYNKGTGEYKMVEVSSVVNYKYKEYYDANKNTSNGGLTFTYDNKGFEVENKDYLVLKIDENKNPVKDSNGNYVYDTIKRSSLVTGADLTSIISNGLTAYSGSQIYNYGTTTAITQGNIVNEIYNTGTPLYYSNNSNEISTADSSIDYNNYNYGSNPTIQYISNNYKKKDGNYIMLLQSTVDGGKMDGTKDQYVNAYYEDDKNNVYRLKNETNKIKEHYSTINLYHRYKKYLVEGKWQLTELSNSPYITASAYKPYEVTPKYNNFIDREYAIDGSYNSMGAYSGYGAYLAKVKSGLGSVYDSLYIGQDLGMQALETRDVNGNATYKFVITNLEENLKTDNLLSNDYLSSNVVAETMITNKTNVYYDPARAINISANHLLVRKEKVKIYSLAEKIPYNLIYVVEQDDVNNLAVLDMRYQYEATNFMKKLANSNTPFYVKGDDLSSAFTINGLRYIKNDNGIKQNVSIVNGAISSDARQGAIKPGFLTLKKEGDEKEKQYIETVVYNKRVYKLGNVAGTNADRDFKKQSKEYKDKLIEALAKNIRSKDAVEVLRAISQINANDFFTSNLYKVTLDFNAITDKQLEGSTIDKINLLQSVISVGNNSSSLSTLMRSNKYIRLGDACYYDVGSIDSYWSYRGVDVSTDNTDISTWNKTADRIGETINVEQGLLNLVTSWISFNLGDTIGTANPKNELAYVAYSPLIQGTYSKVCLKDILDGNSEINQWFVEVELGIDGSKGASQYYNLPFANCEWSCVNDSGSAEKTTTTGVHFFNLSDAGTGIRYLASDDPSIRILSTASAWYETMFGDWSKGGSSEKIKIAYGKKESILQSKIEKTDLTFKGMGRNSSDTFSGFYSDTLDAFEKKYGTKYAETGEFPKKEFEWTKTAIDALNVVTRHFGAGSNDTYLTLMQKSKTTELSASENNYYIISYCQYETSIPWLSDTSNWFGNTEQFFEDVVNTVVDGVKKGFKWLVGKLTGNDDSAEEDVIRGEKHYAMTFYQLPTYKVPEDTINFFEFNFVNGDEVELQMNDLTKLYKVIDNDYQASTNFNIEIKNLSATGTATTLEGAFWGFELYCIAPKNATGFDGWEYHDGVYYYIYKNRLSSRRIDNFRTYPTQTVHHYVNLMLQKDVMSNSVVIENLPAGYTYTVNCFTAEQLNRHSTSNDSKYILGNIKSKLGINQTEIITKTIEFETGPNLVYNPYNNTLKNKLITLSTPSKIVNGDAYLKDNTIIDYEIQKFIFNTENVNKDTYSEKGYVDFKNYVDNQTYRFSSQILMKKYLNTENISKIAFNLYGYNTSTQSKVTYSTNAEYKVYDVSLGKIAATGKFNNTGYLNNLILYELTVQDKLVLNSRYNGIIDSKFINEYLLTNKLIFSIKTKDKDWLSSDHRFEISWKPYYEDTMAFLDYNQNGLYDDLEDVRKDGVPYYTSNVMPISYEASSVVNVEYEHILSETEWTKTKISNGELTLEDLIPYSTNGWFQLCLYKDGESHITK